MISHILVTLIGESFRHLAVGFLSHGTISTHNTLRPRHLVLMDAFTRSLPW